MFTCANLETGLLVFFLFCLEMSALKSVCGCLVLDKMKSPWSQLSSDADPQSDEGGVRKLEF